jgi:hypothetical protein
LDSALSSSTVSDHLKSFEAKANHDLEVKNGLGIPFETIPVHHIQLFFQVCSHFRSRTRASLTVSTTGSLGHHPHIQSLSRVDQDLHHLPIHAHFYDPKDHPDVPYHGRRPDTLWLLDHPRISFYVHPRGLVLEHQHLGPLHEQACLLVLQRRAEYHYRYYDLRYPDASLEATAASATTKDRSHVRLWIWCLVSCLPPQSSKLVLTEWKRLRHQRHPLEEFV